MLWPRRIFCQLLVLFIVLFIVGCSPAYTPRLVEEREREESGVFVDVLPLSQYPDYPTGCESVTAVMALHYAVLFLFHSPFKEQGYQCLRIALIMEQGK